MPPNSGRTSPQLAICTITVQRSGNLCCHVRLDAWYAAHRGVRGMHMRAQQRQIRHSAPPYHRARAPVYVGNSWTFIHMPVPAMRLFHQSSQLTLAPTPALAWHIITQPRGHSDAARLRIFRQLLHALGPRLFAVGLVGVESGCRQHRGALGEDVEHEHIPGLVSGVVLRHDLLNDLPLHGIHGGTQRGARCPEVEAIETGAKLIARGDDAAFRCPYIGVDPVGDRLGRQRDRLPVAQRVVDAERGHDGRGGDVDDLAWRVRVVGWRR